MASVSQASRTVVSHAMSHGSVNKLLASLPTEDYQRIVPNLRRVSMTRHQVLVKQDHPVELVYFPTGGACSLVKTLQDGQVAEVATIGSEGAIGASVFFGQRFAECDVLVQQTCESALAMSADAFNAEMDRRGAFFNHVIRYNQALMSQIMQTTACNGLHSAEQRCARWLLTTHDRAGAEEFPLTHENVAAMLGVRRPTVTITLAALQRAQVIDHRRGTVRILDRARLEDFACECYATTKSQMRRLLPELTASSN